MNKPVAKSETEERVLQIRRVGNSVGLILPKDLLARLRLKEGDKLHYIEQPERGLKLSPFDEKHDRAMKIARKAMSSYANTLHTLAK
ncbi:MAG: AbrB family transcriptional regulator [Rhizobiales bacterium 65-9]|nr:AbrB/MazE/SpoVT family DNA-binding domain-containing protein [Hyphomicrobiales bacterium]OJY35882.1 MAG: AbrB family transcriptional regulator [Rhizobiales bacterium 65-9]